MKEIFSDRLQEIIQEKKCQLDKAKRKWDDIIEQASTPTFIATIFPTDDIFPTDELRNAFHKAKSDLIKATREFLLVSTPTVEDITSSIQIPEDRVETYKMIAHIIYQHIVHPETKKHIPLLTGHTGSGKTYCIQTIAKAYDCKFVNFDVSSVSPSGLVGPSVDSIINAIAGACDYNEHNLGKVVVLLDEIDKLCHTPHNMDPTELSMHRMVQSQLLKLIEGCSFVAGGQGSIKSMIVDTSKVQFVFAGSFQAQNLTANATSECDLTRKIQDAGMIPELCGRINGGIYVLREPTDDAIRSVLHDRIEEYSTQNNINITLDKQGEDCIIDYMKKSGLGYRALDKALFMLTREAVCNANISKAEQIRKNDNDYSTVQELPLNADDISSTLMGDTVKSDSPNSDITI